jgi:hypothetical protein
MWALPCRDSTIQPDLPAENQRRLPVFTLTRSQQTQSGTWGELCVHRSLALHGRVFLSGRHLLQDVAPVTD